MITDESKNYNIYSDLIDIKLQIQEIKLLDARDEREKKIEKLETDIKKLEEEFNKNNIDKKDIEGKIGTHDKLISEIGSNTNRISWIISLFGTIITIIVIFFSFKFENNINKETENIKIEAEKQIKNWISENADKEFNPKIEEYIKQFKEKLENSEQEVNTHYIKPLKEKVNEILNFSGANNYNVVETLVNKGKLEEEMAKYNEIIKKYRDSKGREELVASALLDKGVILGQLEKSEEAIKVYDEVIEKFKTSKESSILEQVAKALYNKGLTLGQLGKLKEAIKVYDEVIEKFKTSKESGILEVVASALLNKGVILGQLRKLEEAIEINNEIIKRFKDSKENVILELVAKALSNKGIALQELGKLKEAIKVYDEVIEKFKTSKESSILEQVAKALYNKGLTLGQLGKLKEAIKVYDEVIEKFKTSKESGILEVVAKALSNKGLTLGQLGKSEEEIKVYDEVIEKFKTSKERRIIEIVVEVLLNRIETNLILGNTNSKEDLDLCIKLIKDDKERQLQFEMLQIIEKAKKLNQDKEIEKWQTKYKDTKLEDWSFNELKTWVKTLEDEAKERILKYIDTFENHNK